MNRSYSRIIPDLLVSSRNSPHARIAVDAKYKLYDEQKVSPSDLYQSFLYAYAYGVEREGETPRAIIIYPGMSGSPRAINLRVKSATKVTGAGISAFSLSIPECLKEVSEGGEGGSALAALREAVMMA